MDQMDEMGNVSLDTISMQRDMNAGERTVRSLAGGNAKASVETQNKIKDLMGKEKSIESLYNEDQIMKLLYDDEQLKNMDPEKLAILKAQAPKVYDRYLKLDSVNQKLGSKKDKLSELKDAVNADYQQASKELEHIQKMTE